MEPRPRPHTSAKVNPLRDWGVPVAGRHAAPRPAGRAADPGRPRVLVVEDDTDTRRALLLALAEELGESVAPAADGVEALWVAAAAPPDVVVLDIGLPGCDGYEVARRLREDPRTAGAWLVALTGTGSPREAARAGFDQFLAKPADFGALALAVRRGLARGGSPVADTRDVPALREIELLADRLGPLAEEVASGAERELADLLEQIERELRN